jgi:hypothetical protein
MLPPTLPNEVFFGVGTLIDVHQGAVGVDIVYLQVFEVP